MDDVLVGPDDPRRPDVVALVERHHARMYEVTPPEDVYALDVDALADPAISFFSARCGGQLVAIGALKDLGEGHAEVKSMHVAAEARGRGLGRAVLDHLVSVARARGCTRLSLETGEQEAFAPARALYVSAGFEPCAPWGEYLASGSSACMRLELAPP